MDDKTEVQRFEPWEVPAAYRHDIWVRATDYDALAAKLADAERVARYETDIAQQTLDQMRAAEAKLAEAEAERDALHKRNSRTLNAARKDYERAEAAEARIAHLENHIEGVAKDTHKIMVAYATAHADVLRVAQTLEDAYWSREVTPTPTAAELMARIKETGR